MLLVVLLFVVQQILPCLLTGGIILVNVLNVELFYSNAPHTYTSHILTFNTHVGQFQLLIILFNPTNVKYPTQWSALGNLSSQFDI